MTMPRASEKKCIDFDGHFFAWSRKRDSRMPMLAALLTTIAAFAYALYSLRVDLGSHAPAGVDHATLIIAGENNSIGLELKRRAREEGPFPLRFDPAGDEAVATILNKALDAIRFVTPPYAPRLRPLVESSAIATPSLAAVGEAVFPRRALPAIEALAKSEARPQPMLTPISGIGIEEMPRSLPEFSGEIDSKPLRDSWRFMIHVDASGRVLDCVALNGGESPATSTLTEWLRQVEFQISPSGAVRWFAIDLGIINQARHASDPY